MAPTPQWTVGEEARSIMFEPWIHEIARQRHHDLLADVA
jgi:hypothetical protein